MNRASWRSRIVDALVIVLAVCVVTRAVGNLLQPLVSTLLAFVLVGAAIEWASPRYPQS